MRFVLAAVALLAAGVYALPPSPRVVPDVDLALKLAEMGSQCHAAGDEYRAAPKCNMNVTSVCCDHLIFDSNKHHISVGGMPSA